jgi:alpha-tubulin suppressor-like RCC1 family protein
MKSYAFLIVSILLMASMFPFASMISHDEQKSLLNNHSEMLSGSNPVIPLVNVSITNSSGFVLATGWVHTCLSSPSSSQVTCFGKNTDGPLGNGLATSSAGYPTESISLGSNVIDIDVGTHKDTGGGFTCAVTEINELYCWGGNNAGQLGQGTEENSLVPLKVNVGNNLGVLKVSTGFDFACAIITDGTVKCWGYMNDGRIGNGNLGGQQLTPISTNSLGVGRSAIDISSGFAHTCALLDDGSVVCWGYGSNGRLGHGGTNTKSSPFPVSGISATNPTKQITAGYQHTCALMVNGTVQCWGNNAYGELGRVSTSTSINSIPQPVQGLEYKNVIHIDAGYHATCAVIDDGSAYCWGKNVYGQLGDGNRTPSEEFPVKVSNLGFNRKAVTISTYSHHTCVLLDDASVNCWGQNGYGELGDGSFNDAYLPREYANRTLSSPVVETMIEQQNYEVQLDGEIFEVLNKESISITLEKPGGMTFDSSSMILSGRPNYSTQTEWQITVSDGATTQTGDYSLRILPDTDLDSISNIDDLDDDNDGVPDELDACPTQAGNSTDDVIGCIDSDGDGVSNNGDSFPNDKTQQSDNDQDGYGDNALGNLPDGCPSIYGQSLRGDLFGCVDADGDGWANSIDAYVGELSQWNDSDGDGYGDSLIGYEGDSCPEIYGTSSLDRYGCPDIDGDGWSDVADAFPNEYSQHLDGDLDGYGDNQSNSAHKPDAFPTIASQWEDTDGDGMGDNQKGINADIFSNDPTQWRDIDSDGYGDNPNGTTPDAFITDPTQWADADGDGYGDNPAGRLYDQFPLNPTQWLDEDGDGLGDNLNGTNADPSLNDFDNDGYNDSIDPLPKLASPGDLDNDGVLDVIDLFPDDSREWSDNDGDGEGDNADTDDDNDGWADTDEVRLGTDPFGAADVPIDSFEIVIPGTAVGLGAWDLIGMFGGIPLFIWIGFGFVTRNGRSAKYEGLLREAQSRDELEDVARMWEYSLMLRMLGPHQGIRLERLRAELDDRFEAQNQTLSSIEPEQHDQTQMVEQAMQVGQKSLPSIDSASPNISISGITDGKGYEWHTDDQGTSWYRNQGSNSEWQRFEA